MRKKKGAVRYRRVFKPERFADGHFTDEQCQSETSRELAIVAHSYNLSIYCQMFKASLNFIGTSRLAWATYVRTYVKKRKEQTCCLVRSAI